MNVYSQLVNPAITGSLSFDIPVMEIIGAAVISGLVTWATISFSVRAARQETSRVLESQRLADVRAAILTIAEAGHERYEEANWRSILYPANAAAALIVLRTSGVHGADKAADWALKYIQYEVIALLDESAALEGEKYLGNWMWFSSGPSERVVTELSSWLADPEAKVLEFEQEIEVMHKVSLKFASNRSAKEASSYPEEDE